MVGDGAAPAASSAETQAACPLAAAMCRAERWFVCEGLV